jgi:signal transduction histidine kinase
MAANDSQIDVQLAHLADYLAARREVILQSWRRAVANDPDLTTASTLSRAQFNDHIPQILDVFDRKLRTRGPAKELEAREEQTAAEHGTHRWQQGYDQREAMREWTHLQLSLLAELEEYARTQSGLTPHAMPIARRSLAELCGEGVAESAARYARLHQAEAAGRLRELEQALAKLNELEQQRAQGWREATHDLRGNLNVVRSASLVLNRERLPEPERARFLAMLERGVGSLQALLSDLTALARLEAGQEHRTVAAFDAASALSELCGDLQLHAGERGLYLEIEGPAKLVVEGDAIKVQRIAQNLLLNALNYTKRGGVTVSWAPAESGDQWTLCIQDTGPGLRSPTVAPLANALKHATDDAIEVEGENASSRDEARDAAPPPTQPAESAPEPSAVRPGEGIGLSIVKRLCELLDAAVDLHTAPGQGTTVRVRFPIRYDL